MWSQIFDKIASQALASCKKNVKGTKNMNLVNLLADFKAKTNNLINNLRPHYTSQLFPCFIFSQDSWRFRNMFKLRQNISYAFFLQKTAHCTMYITHDTFTYKFTFKRTCICTVTLYITQCTLHTAHNTFILNAAHLSLHTENN